ncbi:MAG: apolipoprotein N-acyltransferase [Actinobacteria bacterium]|nr:apolipoprotein N-acyltransferase [Actinomycetota bacterium]
MSAGGGAAPAETDRAAAAGGPSAVRRPARRGLSRTALAAAGGMLLYAGHPPVDVAWAGPLALVPLLALARHCARGPRPLRAAAGWGLLAGLAFFGPLIWWLERFGVLPWALLSLLQASTVAAFVAGMAHWEGRRWRPAVAIVFWVALEAARSVFPLSGFPWGVLGYTQHDGGPLLPVARTLGVLGVSGVCAALGACAEEALHRVRRSPRHAAAPVLSAVATLLAAVGLGLIGPPPPTGRSLDMAAVQGNDIESTSAAGVARVQTGRIVRVAERMVEASRPLARAPGAPPDVVVWPENSLDADIRDTANAPVRALVSEALAVTRGSRLLAGAYLAGPRPDTLYNVQAEVLAPGRLGQMYRKRSAVPFAEYVPARRWLGWFPGLEQVPNDMLAGRRPQLLRFGDARLGTLICFENVFPELARSEVRAGAQLLLVSTSNASFGRTPMSRQHLAFSQLRAVESGRWLLHAGISGISGVVDPGGRVTRRTGLFNQAVVRADLPLIDGATPAVRLGGLVGPAAMVGAALVVAWPTVQRGLRLPRSSRRAR